MNRRLGQGSDTHFSSSKVFTHEVGFVLISFELLIAFSVAFNDFLVQVSQLLYVVSRVKHLQLFSI